MTTPKEHIEEIRKKKFSIGGELNPLTEDLHQATKHLSAELYAKDVHFLMELIQNAEDNEYLEGVDPSLEFIVTSRDITGTGASATLLIFNNEKGFSPKNIDSICSVGRSTKKGNRKRGYIGEKGIGFKSVFLITAQPYIFSNGYKIRFNEEPCPHCNVGYIVPEWVDENPTLSDINQIYGSRAALPTTTIVLPLKPDKVKPVKQQLSNIHPEVLLFLSKIKRLSVKEDNEDPRLNTVSAISISSETNFVTRKNIDAESYTLHLSAEENGDEPETGCSYYMWKQKFPVKQENKVERRMDVEELVITLALPNGERLHRGMSSPGVYAFLPTEMVTNFPFIIQADFLLASSRETILLDDKWNQGILDCVPTAFINAFISLVKTTEDAPVSSLPSMFQFLPVESSYYPKLNAVRESIRVKLVEESIVPCESHMEQKLFNKPCEVGRLFPAFWNILNKAREQGVSFHNLSSHGKYVLNCSFDKEKYDHILKFLGVEPVDVEWYSKCIQSSNLVLGVTEDVYLELLLFLAEKWSSCFQNSNIKNVPLLKYVGLDGNVSLRSIYKATKCNGEKMVFIYEATKWNGVISCKSHRISWLIDWNREFRCATGRFFVPRRTQEALRSCSKRETIMEWLTNTVKVGALSVYSYAGLLNSSLGSNRNLVISYAHFLFHSLSKNYLSEREVNDLCRSMPLLDSYGRVTTQRKGVLVPANGSKWAELIGSNPWREEGYVQLGEEYLREGYFAGLSTPKNQLIIFLKTHVAASDIPDLSPPNAVIPTVLAPLTKHNAFLLLDWICNLKSKRVGMPNKFLTCIKEGSWLRISLSGSIGHRPPSQSFLLTSSLGNLLQNGSVLVDIPLIDQGFYGERINDYTGELKMIGVMFDIGEACEFIGKHFMSLAGSSTLTKSYVFSMLNFIKFLREKYLPTDKFIHSIKEGRWLRTSCGKKSPVGSVLYDQEWRAASQISHIPFIDQDYYGEEILRYKVELELLGVLIGFNQNFQLVADCLKSPAYLTSLTAEAVLLILACMRQSNSSEKLVMAIKDKKVLKTDIGYKSPRECFLFDPQWGCLLEVFSCFPLIDKKFYGRSIFSYKEELRRTGVVVDFEEATKAFAYVFRQRALSFSIGKETVLSFLACGRQLKSTPTKNVHSDFKICIREVEWLWTRLGNYKSPNECILWGPSWESISPIAVLPFIDDSDSYYGKAIHKYRKELKSLGVVVEFEKGAKFVASGLCLPRDPSNITPANMLALLECIRILQREQKDSLPEAFLKKVSQKWLRTHADFRSPDKSILFDSKWGSFLQQTDGPFVDEKFYGSAIASYRKELVAIGVIDDITNGCQLLASHLHHFHSEFTTIVRIYNCLSEMKWEPESDDTRRIWIPNGSVNGEWVGPGKCVLQDKDGLFGSQLYVLEKYYDPKLLIFFSRTMKVKSHPSVDDYCKLWKDWESSSLGLSYANCCAFWGYVTRQWNSKTQKILAEKLAKLPVDSRSDGVLLFDKDDVFLADDLQLKDLFEHSSSQPIFVWCPQLSLPAMPRTKLLEIYSKIGVRTISESVKKEELSVVEGAELKQANPREILIGKGLARLILGFLTDPSVNMEAEKRHQTVKCLLNATVLETVEPIEVSYSLSLSSGEIVNVRASRMLRWDREDSKFLMQKMDRSGGQRNVIEYATYFAEVISKGVLWEREDLICGLSELIKLAFLLEFNEEAVGFLMKNKNLQIFAEDEEFLSTAFHSD